MVFEACHQRHAMNARSGQKRLMSFAVLELNLGRGKYMLTAAAHSEATHLFDCYQWAEVFRAFEIEHFEGFALSDLPDSNRRWNWSCDDE
jgi:hypothetical protein